MKRVKVHYAKTHLSTLLDDVEKGEEIIIERRDKEVARLVAVRQSKAKIKTPVVGIASSAPVTIADDAFVPLSDKELEEWGL